MWVNVSQQVEFPSRFAIVTVPRYMFINAGFPIGDLRLFSTLEEFNEVMLREVLKKNYVNTDDWQLHTAAYRIGTQSIDVVVSSPQFCCVAEGALVPRLPLPEI